KIEPLAAVIEGTVITLSALFILYGALIKIVHPRDIDFMMESVWVMLISITITAVLVIFLNYVVKRTNNMVIKADALHYKTDLFSNSVVLLALGLISITGEQLIDPILGIGIAIFMIYSSIPIIKEGILMLLDASLQEDEIEKIKDVLNSEEAITNYHFLQTRESGSHVFVSAHIVFNVSISLYDAHLVSDKLELGIKSLFEDKKVHVIMHMDPYDDSEINEEEDIY
ncbi:cation diffusion facilitator family transporter, partial [Sulfurimonas sp.]|nr:cation diffusion facilitator family transporter [Sulfurimonas sp.]